MGWGVSTSIEYVLVKFLHIYGTSTPCKDMRSTYQYTRGTKSWPPMQSQLHNHIEGLLKISIHVASVQAASASHCSAASLASPSLTSFRRKFQVHFPEFRAAGHTEECAAPRTDAAAQMHSVQCAVCSVQLHHQLRHKLWDLLWLQLSCLPSFQNFTFEKYCFVKVFLVFLS